METQEKSISYQKRMNVYLVKRNFRLAYQSFLKMNQARSIEGFEFLSMPSLQSKFEK